MVNYENSFQGLMSSVGAGSEAAVTRLLDLYGDHLFRAVRRRLNRTLRSKFDSQDFVQAVWASFFRDPNHLSRFERPDELVAFLTQVAGNKVIDECRRRMQTQKNNVNREVSIDEDSQKQEVLTGREPKPSEVAIAREQWERMTNGQPSHYRKILELRVDGETHERIASTLEVNEKTVRRVLNKMSSRLES